MPLSSATLLLRPVRMEPWLLLLLLASANAYNDLPDFVAVNIKKLDRNVFKVYTRIENCSTFYHKGRYTQSVLYQDDNTWIIGKKVMNFELLQCHKILQGVTPKYKYIGGTQEMLTSNRKRNWLEIRRTNDLNNVGVAIRIKVLKKCEEITGLGLIRAQPTHREINDTYWRKFFPNENIFVSTLNSQNLWAEDIHAGLAEAPGAKLFLYSGCQEVEAHGTNLRDSFSPRGPTWAPDMRDAVTVETTSSVEDEQTNDNDSVDDGDPLPEGGEDANDSDDGGDLLIGNIWFYICIILLATLFLLVIIFLISIFLIGYIIKTKLPNAYDVARAERVELDHLGSHQSEVQKFYNILYLLIYVDRR